MKLTAKKLDREISRLFGVHAQNVQFNIMDLNKIHNEVSAAILANEDRDAAMVAAVAKYRVKAS